MTVSSKEMADETNQAQTVEQSSNENEKPIGNNEVLKENQEVVDQVQTVEQSSNENEEPIENSNENEKPIENNKGLKENQEAVDQAQNVEQSSNENEKPIENSNEIEKENESENTQDENSNEIVKLRRPPTNGVQRALETLAETETEETTEEIRKVDTQLDVLSQKLNDFEVKMRNRNSKVEGMIENQRQVRLERRRSFHQRIQDGQKEDDDFHSRVAQMLSKCQHLRRVSVQDPSALSGASGTS